MPIAGNTSKCNAEDAAKTPFFTVMETDYTIKNMGVFAEVVDKEYPPFAEEKLFRHFNQAKRRNNFFFRRFIFAKRRFTKIGTTF